MKKCSVNENHFYADHLSYCPWCKIAKETGKDPFPGPIIQQIPSKYSPKIPSSLVQKTIPAKQQVSLPNSINQKPRSIQNKNPYPKILVFGTILCLLIFGVWNLIGNDEISPEVQKEGLNTPQVKSVNTEYSEILDTSNQVTGLQKILFQQVEYESTSWKNQKYTVIEIIGNNFVPLKSSSKNKLARMALDNGEYYTLITGEVLDLGGGYAIEAKQVDVGGNKVWLEFTKDGEFVDDEIIDCYNDETWEVKIDDIEEEDDVVVLRVHVQQVFQGAVDSIAQIDGLWLIDYANAFTVEVGDELNGYEIMEIGDGYISYKSQNSDTSTIAEDKLPETFKNTIDMEFVKIPAGEFMMGSPSGAGRSYEHPIHKVSIEESYYLGKFEVTQKQWREVMGKNPSNFKGDDLPVEKVSWNDVQEFIEKLNEKEGTNKYRLPSEAEWEYACRAGTTTRYYFGDDESRLKDYAWYGEDWDSGSTHPVGQKKPNPWGLYDMHGNVWEWIQDRWHDDYDGAPSDGSSWEDGYSSGHVIRGGEWCYSTEYCRSAFRGGIDPDDRTRHIGFRVLREI